MKRNGDTGDKRTWHIGGKQLNRDKDAERYKGFGRRKEKETIVDPVAEVVDTPQQEIDLIDTGEVIGASSDIMAGLAGLDLSSPTIETGPGRSIAEPLLSASTVDTTPIASPVKATPISTLSPTSPRKTVLTHGADKLLAKLLHSNEGVLYEDGQLQVGIKSEFHGHQGRIALFFGNKISVSLQSFTVTIEVEDSDALAVMLPKIPSSTLSAMSQMQQLVQVECKNVFTTLPILKISYLAGSLQTIAVQLPIHMIKFLQPVKLSSSDFFERWKQIGGPPRESQNIFPISLNAGRVDVERNRKVVSGANFGVLEEIDPNPSNIVAAGVLHMSTGGKVGCLLRVEPNLDAQVSLSDTLR